MNQADQSTRQVAGEDSSRPSRLRERLSFFLYSLVLFHLPAGRITYPLIGFGEIKVGESVENLLPLLILARFLDRYRNPGRCPLSVEPLKTGLLLLFGGLFISLAANPSSETLEDILRLAGQAVCGWLLAEWISHSNRNGGLWPIGFLLGMALLLIRTPWGQLGNPDLEGPFTHRNIQAAFFLLSFPLLSTIVSRRDRWGNRFRFVALLAVFSAGTFLLLSKSRAGVLGVGCAAFIMLLVLVWEGHPSRRRVFWGVGLVGVAVVVTGLFLFPRFRGFGQELGNPYHRSRAGIWAAAVEGWCEPSRYLLGIGMGDSFDQILLDSPTGNLNHRLRRAHYPHCLYFQWIYWGGVTALLGWFYLITPVGGKVARKGVAWEVRILGACLLGYAVLELFESALRDQRVSALFWLDLILLCYLNPTGERDPADAERGDYP